MPSLPEVHASIPVPSPHSPWTKKFGAFVGLGFMISVGYIDPGNWATDLTG
jgi:manganese transport protein